MNVFIEKQTKLYEQLHEKNKLFAYAKTKTQVTAKLISAFVFATQIVQSLYSINPNSSLLPSSMAVQLFVLDMVVIPED